MNLYVVVQKCKLRFFRLDDMLVKVLRILSASVYNAAVYVVFPAVFKNRTDRDSIHLSINL